MVILDCCFSGAFAQGAKGDDDLGIGERLVGEGRGRVVLTASRGTEYSFEGEPVHGEDAARGSVFTGALVDGIRSGCGRRRPATATSPSTTPTPTPSTRSGRRARTRRPQRWLYGAEGSILLAHTPPPAKELAPPPPERLATPEPATPEPPPPTPAPELAPPGPVRPRVSTRTVIYAVAAALLLGGAVLLGVLLAPGSPSGSTGTSGGSSTGTGAASGQLTATAPWRIVIRDNIEGNDVGCNVTVTNTRTGDQRVWKGLYGSFLSYQMHDSGSFRYSVNDPGCLVVQHSGAGSVPLPFSWKPGTGDTDAFRTKGPVQVTVLDFAGNSSCHPELHAVKDGRILDYGTVEKGGGCRSPPGARRWSTSPSRTAGCAWPRRPDLPASTGSL